MTNEANELSAEAEEIKPVKEEKKTTVTKTEIVLSEEKRGKISQIDFPGVESYSVEKDGTLSIVHEEGKPIDEAALSKAVEDFVPQKTDAEIVSEKKDEDITAQDLAKVLRQKGIL